ncbi:MAG: serine kinase [Candidatus Eisenbacteria bacterium]
MKLREIVQELNFRVITGKEKLDGDVTHGYTSDLLSDVMANSKEGDLWITLQTHQNVVAVAKLKDLAGIVLVNTREPDADTTQKAAEEKVCLLQTEEASFVVSGKLYALLSTKG